MEIILGIIVVLAVCLYNYLEFNENKRKRYGKNKGGLNDSSGTPRLPVSPKRKKKSCCR